jgi:prephenate dehydrogenase
MFKKIGILGLGLIGGSLAKALKKYNYDCLIYGYNRNQSAVDDAYNMGSIDIKVTDLSQFKDCDLLILSCPVNINIQLFKSLLPYLNDETVITDVGSTKGDIYKAILKMDYKGFFIGGHPMAGSEKSGFSATKAELFENAYYILTPEPDSPSHLIKKMENLAQTIHALPVILDPDYHDYIVAAISHVPHILASSLVNMVENLDSDKKDMYALAAGGFKDFTRIASSSPGMWQQICLANRDSILEILDVYQQMLRDVRLSVANLEEKEVYDFFQQSKTYRNTFQNQVRGSIEKVYALFVDVKDEPGVIARIATYLSEKQISIKNIGINNNREDFEGVLEITLTDQHSLEMSRNVISQLGYDIIEN